MYLPKLRTSFPDSGGRNMNWFWTPVELGAGTALGLFLISIGIRCFADSLGDIAEQAAKLRDSMIVHIDGLKTPRFDRS